MAKQLSTKEKYDRILEIERMTAASKALQQVARYIIEHKDRDKLTAGNVCDHILETTHNNNNKVAELINALQADLGVVYSIQ